VLAPDFAPPLEAMKGDVEMRRQAVEPGKDLRNLVQGFDIVVAATDDRAVNRRVIESCSGMKVLRYAVDDPEVSDFFLLSTTRLGDIEIGVSTGGKSPGLARALRERIEAIITREDVEQVKLQEFARRMAKERLQDQDRRKDVLFRIMRDDRVRQLLRDERLDEAKLLAARIIEAS